MNMPEDEDLDHRLAAAWREYAARPPRRSPSDAAAAIALQIRQLPARRQRPTWYLAAAAALLLAAVSTTVLWKPLGTSPRSQPAAVQGTSLGKGEVLMWLDEKTPLYMTFQEPDEDQAKGGKS